MPYDNKTIQEIKLVIQNNLTDSFNENFPILPKGLVKVLSAVIAGVFIILFKQIGWLFLQLFPEYAYWGEVNILGKKIRPLLELGNLIGVGYPLIGTQWEGEITVQVTQIGKFLDGGVQLKSSLNNKIYLVKETILLNEDNKLIPVICSSNGIAGNLEPGDPIQFPGSLSMVKKNAIVTNVKQVARDDEIENEYRKRVSQRFRTPPMGGALSDYRQWSNEVSGVWNSYPQKDFATPAGVLIWVAGIPSQFKNRIPDDELLRKVGDSCTYDPITKKATRKPVAAIIDPSFNGTYKNVMPIMVILFKVIVYGLEGVEVDDFYDLCKAALNDYFLSREPYIRGLSDDNNKTNVISKNSISSVVYQAAAAVKAEFDRVELIYNNESVLSYMLIVGQLAEMETLQIFEGLDSDIDFLDNEP
jgi:hypothetical protein